MVKTAEQILEEIGEESESTYASPRRKRGLPPVPCANAYRGCPGMYGGKRGGRGWCPRCYDRWRFKGDSWAHSPYVIKCTRKDCFMRGKPGHP